MNIIERKINNLKVYFIQSPNSTTNTVQFWFRAGSSLETGKDKGIAHFLEHMFFKGTKKRPGAKIAHEVESFGGEINAFTSFDYTCYYINSPKDQLKKTTEILMDMVSNPLFSNDELIPERGVVFEEYRRSIDNPHHYNFHQIQKNSFSASYSHPILGNEKTIKSFQRKQLLDFRKKFYNTSNSALFIAGNFNKTDSLEKIIKNYKLPKGPKTQYKKFNVKNIKESIHLHTKDVNQATLTLIIDAPKYETQAAVNEDLAINCFAYGETCYLHQRLVKETSLATATSGSSMFMNNGGAHFLKIVYPTDNHRDVIKELIEIIKKTKKEKFDPKDIEKIKNQYVASKIYEQESLEAYTFSLGHGFAQNEDLYSEQEFIKRIEKTSARDVNNCLNNIFENDVQIHLQLPENEDLNSFKKDLKNLEKSFKETSKNIKSTHKPKSSSFDKSVQHIKLNDGLSVLYRKNAQNPTFACHAYVKGGISKENESNCGSHYLIGKTLTLGHKDKDYKKLRTEMETLSAHLTGFSGKNAYGVTCHGLSRNFDSLFNDFLCSLRYPNFDNNLVDLEKEMMQRYLDNVKKDPVKQCFKKFKKSLFKDTPYALDLMGNEKTIKEMNSNSIKQIHESNLNNNEIMITLSGDIDLDSSIKYIQDQLDFKKKKIIKAKEFNLHNSGERYHIDFDREQTQVFIGYEGLSLIDQNDMYLKMISTYLSGQSSELFVEVRDRQGLCYSTQPIHHTALQAGYWGIYIGAGADKVDKAITAINQILNRIKNKGLKESEVKRLSKMIVGQQKMQLQTNEDFANYYSIPVLHGLGLDFENKKIEKIKKVSSKELNKFLKKFLSRPQLIVTAGPN